MSRTIGLMAALALLAGLAGLGVAARAAAPPLSVLALDLADIAQVIIEDEDGRRHNYYANASADDSRNRAIVERFGFNLNRIVPQGRGGYLAGRVYRDAPVLYRIYEWRTGADVWDGSAFVPCWRPRITRRVEAYARSWSLEADRFGLMRIEDRRTEWADARLTIGGVTRSMLRDMADYTFDVSPGLHGEAWLSVDGAPAQRVFVRNDLGINLALPRNAPGPRCAGA